MTMLGSIRRIGAFLTVTAAALTATGCGGTDSSGSAAEWAAPAAATPTASAPAPIKKITSACALLPANVVVSVLGSSSGTKLTAEEQPVDQKDSEPTLGCAYESKGQEAMAINVVALRDRATDGASTLDTIARKSGAKVTHLDGLGDAAVTYVSDGTRFLAFAVAYQSDLRVVLFTGAPVVPVAKYKKLAEHIAPQL
ncbi:hypothetical protein [Micromonospora sp. NPDC005806]|uniref:hypothetical protein n=1 Tax=Micromonospora sp. NPDC005806 TaxID=3364234 RepID=UPI0036A76185